ncbi:MAG: sigma-54 dependent transcriptional regulator [Deltaproteobacteria bacterium]|nr:sigma-54 dependent transcriptional regulator [Deltaproteobacteria bacterium]
MTILTLPNAEGRSLTVRAKALVFEDERSRALLRRLEQVAPSHATVLVIGETGTGKEIVARHIHELSPRARGPFVAVNCGAFSETLVESELFGHEKGSFTGAVNTKQGWFEAADGGTLFLDEIGDLPAAVQVKLLRVLQEREVVRVGSRQPIPINVRLVAATNVKLEQAVAEGRFREDLYYRLRVAVLELPSLRERPGDILPLARFFLEQYRHRLGIAEVKVTREGERRLLAHSWPGNIRELENVIHSALLVCHEGLLDAKDLNIGTAISREVPTVGKETNPIEKLEAALLALFDENPPELHAKIEETVMRVAFDYCHRNQLQTARLLGISRNIVRARLIQIGELAGVLRGSGSVEVAED